MLKKGWIILAAVAAMVAILGGRWAWNMATTVETATMTGAGGQGTNAEIVQRLMPRPDN